MDKVRTAVIVGTYGLKGQLKINVKTSVPETRFAPGAKAYLGAKPDNVSAVEIATFSPKSPVSALVSFVGLADINMVEKFVGLNIYADKNRLDDGFYIDDLIGFKIVDSSGKVYGTADSAYTWNGKVYFMIDKVLLPFERPRFIAEVDESKKLLILSDLGQELFL